MLWNSWTDPMTCCKFAGVGVGGVAWECDEMRLADG